MPDEFASISEACEELGITRERIRLWIDQGIVKATRKRRSWIIDRASLESLVEHRRNHTYTMQEAMVYAGVSSYAVSEWAVRRYFEAFKDGGLWVIDRESFEAYVAKRQARAGR